MATNSSQVVHRLLRGLGAQGFGQVVNLFIRLAEVPLFLAFWGAERYGEWLMVAAIPTYLTITDGGFTGTTQREMTMRMGAGDRQGALASFQSIWVLLLVLSVAIIGLAALVVAVLPLAEWLHLKTMHGEAVQIVILLLTAYILVGFQSGLSYGGYSCEGRYGRGTVIYSLSCLFEFAGLALAIMLGGGAVEAAGGFFAGRILGLLVFIFDLSKVAPWLRYGWKHASFRDVARLSRPSFAAMAYPLGIALNIQGMRLVVGIVLGPAVVATFTALRTLCRAATQPMTVISRLIEPEIAMAFGTGNAHLLRSLFTRSCQSAAWFGSASCLMLWLVGEKLLSLWTHGAIAMETGLYAFLLLTSAVNSVWYTALMVPYATNRHERVALLYLFIYGAGAAFLAIPMMILFGVTGAGAALFAAETAMTAGVLPAAVSMSGESWREWTRVVISPPWFLMERLRATITLR